MSNDDRGPLLTAHLHEARRTAFAWGARDCSLFVAEWVRSQRGADPAAVWRGHYRTELGAARKVTRAGGLVAVFAAALEPIGLERTEAPVTGDVGVILASTPRGLRPAGAILAGRRWVTRGKTGIVALEVEPLAAWRV